MADDDETEELLEEEEEAAPGNQDTDVSKHTNSN